MSEIIRSEMEGEIKDPTECPSCGHTWWQEGPMAGCGQNYRCRRCGLIINVVGDTAEQVGTDTRNLPDAFEPREG